MELGDQTAGERTERFRLDVILDKLNDVYGELLDTVETGGLDQLDCCGEDQLVASASRPSGTGCH